jgi:hypothetical protein
MITDKQGREWLFQKLYDDGWRYIIGSNSTFIYLTKIKPLIIDGFYKCNGEEYTCIGRTHGILPDLEIGEVMDIADELGIIDWSKVEVDTPVLVSNDNKEWIKRYFARYEDGNVYCWLSGKTSWTAICELSIGHWDYTKLAEV